MPPETMARAKAIYSARNADANQANELGTSTMVQRAKVVYGLPIYWEQAIAVVNTIMWHVRHPDRVHPRIWIEPLSSWHPQYLRNSCRPGTHHLERTTS
jgi:hypothetical protein